MKRIILLFSVAILCLILCLGLVSCGGNDNSGTENSGTETGGTENSGTEDSITDSVQNSGLTTDSDTEQGGGLTTDSDIEQGGGLTTDSNIEQGGGLVPDPEPEPEPEPKPEPEPEPEPEKEYVTIAFDTQGGNKISSVQVEMGRKIPKPNNVEKPGYTLVGWYIDEIEWVFIGYVATENMTLVAKWVPTEYSIEYVGEVEHNNKTSYTIDDEIVLGGSDKEFYEFLGWYEDEEYTKPITKIEKGTIGNLKIYGKTNHQPLVFKEIAGGYEVCELADKNTRNLIIPDMYDGKPVVSIAKEAFLNCTSLENVEIGIGITAVGEDAFKGCTGLAIYCRAKSKPSGWDEWWDGDFAYVWDIKEYGDTQNGLKWAITNENEAIIVGSAKETTQIIVPEIINTSNVTTIARYAFHGRNDIESVVLPSSVKTIENQAFGNCDGLKNVDIGNGVTTIGVGAFLGCDSLKYIVIPNNVVKLGSSAFHNCDSLEGVALSIGLLSIGSYAFSSCESLEFVGIPSSVITVGKDAFSDCTRLVICHNAERQPDGWDSVWAVRGPIVVWNAKEFGIDDNGFKWVTINNKEDEVTVVGVVRDNEKIEVAIPVKINNKPVTTISQSSFGECENLERVTIPSGITTIGYQAFYNCDKLVSVVIPSSVITVGSSVFLYSDNVTIYCEAESEPDGWKFDWNGNRPFAWNIKEFGTDGTGIKWAITNGNEIIIVGASKETTKLEIPRKINDKTVTAISSYAFYNYSNLKSVTIPNSVISIGECAFYNCTSLASIELPNNVTSIDAQTFYNCTGLTSVTIPSSVTTIGYGAFWDCTNLTSVTIPNSVTSIDTYAFRDCTKLTIYCEAESQPSGWNSYWNYSNCPVVWDYKNK